MENDFLSDLIIFDIVGSIKLQTKANVSTGMKNRQYWGIAIKTSGKTTYHCKGKAFNSDAENIVLLPKSCSYDWTSSGGECLLLNFEANINHDCVLSFPIRDNGNFIELFNKIERLRILKPTNYKMKSIQLLYKFIILLLDSQKPHYVDSKKIDLLKPAIDYIIENYDDYTISGESLSKMTTVSYTYFRKLFVESYGSSPMEYVHKLRMKKAQEMLASDYSSIEKIAEAVGYNSIYNFSKMFKKYYGVSPSKYFI